MEILLRIRELIESRGLKVNSFANEIGIAQTTLSTYFTKNRYPAYETIRAILEVFPEVSAEWLMRGKGSMYICDDLPKFRGDETETEEDLHAALAKCRAELENSQNENVKLLEQLDFMEQYNLKIAGRYNKLQKRVDELEGNSKKGIV